jgi:hypothetical protein
VLQNIRRDLELEGYKADSEAFEVALRARKVQVCQEMKGLPTCSGCPAYMGCELIKAHRRDIAFGRRKKKTDVVMGLDRKSGETPKT